MRDPALDPPLNRGDIVSLKSGGRLMTVEECRELTRASHKGWMANCIWFDDEMTVHRDTFDCVALQLWQQVGQV